MSRPCTLGATDDRLAGSTGLVGELPAALTADRTGRMRDIQVNGPRTPSDT